MLVFSSENEAKESILANANISYGPTPLIIGTPPDLSWNKSVTFPGLKIGLQAYNQPKIIASGFRVLVSDLKVRDDLWTIDPGLCEFVADRDAACENREFVLRNLPGRSIHAVLFSPIPNGSCYATQRDNELSRFLAEIVKISTGSSPDLFSRISFGDTFAIQPDCIELNRLLNATTEIIDDIKKSNTISPSEKSILTRNLEEGIRYFQENLKGITIAGIALFLGSPILSAYQSVVEDAVKPQIASALKLLLDLVASLF